MAVDLVPLPEPLENTTFRKADLTKWAEQYDVFKWTADTFGRIDIAFLNAGVGEIENMFIDTFGDDGRLKEPQHKVIASSLLEAENVCQVVRFSKKQHNGTDLSKVSVELEAHRCMQWLSMGYERNSILDARFY